MSERFTEQEAIDGLRFTWNMWPNTRADAVKLVIPPVQYEPLTCKSQLCGAILNPFCEVNFTNRFWICCFCGAQNYFPATYVGISPECLPAELWGASTTIDYQPDHFSRANPLFIYVIDSYIEEPELNTLKENIQSLISLQSLNESNIGFITFGKNVRINGLQSGNGYFFSGVKAYEENDMMAQLGNMGVMGDVITPINKLDINLVLSQVFERDLWPKEDGSRPLRATGSAISIAISGPSTVGPGQVVNPSLTDLIRSHHDIIRGEAPHYKKAISFYESLVGRHQAKHKHHWLPVIDLCLSDLDQVGLAEMKNLATASGGIILSTIAFSQEEFIRSFNSLFTFGTDFIPKSENETEEVSMFNQCYEGTMDIILSKNVKLSGSVGSMISAEKKSAAIAETELGIGGTTAYYLGGLDNRSFVIFFEVCPRVEDTANVESFAYGQFITIYRNGLGRKITHVTSFRIPLVPIINPARWLDIRTSFDQEAAIVALAHLSVFNTEKHFLFDILRYIDRVLIRLFIKFVGDENTQAHGAQTLQIPAEMLFFPQFVFHLRRSQFLQVFNNSPDETSYFRFYLMREDVTNSLVMIEPTLIAYSLEAAPQPVLLDVSSVDRRKIILLDTFFNVVILYGSDIAIWRDDHIELREEFSYFKPFLENPLIDAKRIIDARFPTPHFLECDQNTSQSRFVMAKLNPSITHHNEPNPNVQSQQAVVFSDDVSLTLFMEYLAKVVKQGVM